MKKVLMIFAVMGMSLLPAAPDLAWWTNARFGMFIHWGLYSLPARHEWIQRRESIAPETYAQYFRHFNPDLFDAKLWARRAKAAGMKYAVLTVKHHEGFCLWDSKFTDYKATNTPGGRDYVREFVDAFRAEGLRVGFYYSLIDWHHPDFEIDCNHPLSGVLKLPETKEAFAKANVGRDMAKYRLYMLNQIRELLTAYGKIDIMWFDYSYPTALIPKGRSEWGSEEIIKLTRSLQPQIIVDNRLDLDDKEYGWDFITPEQFKVQAWPEKNGRKVPWETCQTFSGSWGYHRDEMNWKSPAQLIELLSETVSKGGNLILNVGPTARGEFDSRAVSRLTALGEWMHYNSRSIYGCTAAPAEFKPPENTLLTWNPATKRLYIHLLAYPMGRLHIAFADRIEYLQFLHDGSELKIKVLPEWQKYAVGGGTVADDGFIELPVIKPEITIPVIELFVKE